MQVVLNAKKRVDVSTFAEASRAVRAHIERKRGNLSLDAFIRFRHAGSIMEGSTLVARVTYDGRVWWTSGCRVHEFDVGLAPRATGGGVA